jgi:hypothetical protein
MSKIFGVHVGQIAIIRDEKTSGTAAQTMSATYIARQLNTLIDPFGMIQNPSAFTGVNGTNTQFVLGPGSYKIRAGGPKNTNGSGQGITQRHKIQNITDGTTVALGNAGYYDGTNGTTADMSDMIAYFTITSTKTFEIQGRGASSSGPAGTAIAFGDNEVYTMVEIQKIA